MIRNAVSLFGGIEVGRHSCKKAKLEVVNYFSSEVNEHAIKIANKNHSDIIQVGDINNWRNWDIDWRSVDLLLGGSPCQGFSFAGRQLNFEDPRSKLFFVYADILNHIRELNPNVKFLLENVKMKKDFQEVITNTVKAEPIEINSALVSAQNRKRLYWTNIEGVIQPSDKGILLEDIVHEKVDGLGYDDLIDYIVPFDKALKILDEEVRKNKIGYFRQDSQANRVYTIHGKAICLCGDAGGGAAKMGQYLFGIVNYPRGNNQGGLRYNGEKSPTMSASMWEHNNHLCLGCITPNRVEKRQNGQRFNDGKKSYTLMAGDQHGILIEGYIRKLTPIECERLQTLPDTYTEGISNAQRYKALGNGWTGDVITGILENVEGQQGYLMDI